MPNITSETNKSISGKLPNLETMVSTSLSLDLLTSMIKHFMNSMSGLLQMLSRLGLLLSCAATIWSTILKLVKTAICSTTY